MLGYREYTIQDNLRSIGPMALLSLHFVIMGIGRICRQRWANRPAMLIGCVIVFLGWSLGSIVPAKGHWWQEYSWADVPRLLAVLLVCAVLVLTPYVLNIRSSEWVLRVLSQKSRSIAVGLFSGLAFGAITGLGGLVASLFLFSLGRGGRVWGIDVMVSLSIYESSEQLWVVGL